MRQNWGTTNRITFTTEARHVLLLLNTLQRTAWERGRAVRLFRLPP